MTRMIGFVDFSNTGKENHSYLLQYCVNFHAEECIPCCIFLLLDCVKTLLGSL